MIGYEHKLSLFSLGRVLRGVVGEWNWVPPAWLASILAEFQKNPRSSAAWVLGAVLLLLGITQGWRLIPQSSPEDRMRAEVSAPALAELGEAGLIPQPLSIDFSGSVADLEQLDKPVTAGIRMEPEMKGAWTWEGDRRLVFYPKEDWPAGTKFRVKLEQRLFGPDVRLEARELSFVTRPLTASLEALQFYVNPLDPAERKITATFSFSHAVDPSSLEKALELKGPELDQLLIRKSGEPRFQVEMVEFGRKAHFRSAAVNLPQKRPLPHCVSPGSCGLSGVRGWRRSWHRM
ncbi:MAG: hypothetical protein HC904_01635 [Blastochloris sp.]|nr:hypothetical protein [Blastochloris sp.]